MHPAWTCSTRRYTHLKPGWQSLTMFCVLNGYRLEVPADDAVDLMLAIAAGELDETAVAAWLAERLQPIDSA